MKLLLSIVIGLLLAWAIVSFVERSTYVLAPVVGASAREFNEGVDDVKIVQAAAAAAGRTVDVKQAVSIIKETQEKQTLMNQSGLALPAPTPTAAAQIEQAQAAQIQAAEQEREKRAAAEAATEVDAFSAGSGLAGGGGMLSGGSGGRTIVQLTGGSAPFAALRDGAPNAGDFTTPAPSPSRVIDKSPEVFAPAPAPAPAPPPRGPKTRREILLDEIDFVLEKTKTHAT